MPTYTFLNKETNEIEEHTFSVKLFDEFKKLIGETKELLPTMKEKYRYEYHLKNGEPEYEHSIFYEQVKDRENYIKENNLITIQRWAEFSNNWEFSDDDGNIINQYPEKNKKMVPIKEWVELDKINLNEFIEDIKFHFSKDLKNVNIQFEIYKSENVPNIIYSDVTRLKQINDSYPKKNGLFIEYYKNGGIKTKGKFKGKLMTGKWDFFRQDGSLMRSGSFKNNKQVGEWITFDSKGKVVKKTNFK